MSHVTVLPAQCHWDAVLCMLLAHAQPVIFFLTVLAYAHAVVVLLTLNDAVTCRVCSKVSGCCVVSAGAFVEAVRGVQPRD